MSKRVIVTGSAGFIGFHTAMRLLREGYAVVGIDNGFGAAIAIIRMMNARVSERSDV